MYLVFSDILFFIINAILIQTQSALRMNTKDITESFKFHKKLF